MADKKATGTGKDSKKGTGLKDLAPKRDPKGGEVKSNPVPLPRGGWDGNHNVAIA